MMKTYEQMVEEWDKLTPAEQEASVRKQVSQLSKNEIIVLQTIRKLNEEAELKQKIKEIDDLIERNKNLPNLL